MQTVVSIAGMRSAHCVRAIFTALAGVPGTARADVSMGRAVIEHDGRATPEAIAAAVAPLGYSILDVAEHRRRLAVRDDDDRDAVG